jgi:hypothetical protein
MTLVETYGKEIVSSLVPFITFALNSLFKAKAKLLLSIPHSFTYLVQQPLLDAQGKVVSPTQTVKTNSVVLQNAGRDTATNVELVFNWKPTCINIWPSRHFTEHVEADNRYIMIFDSLAPREIIGCELLAINAELPNLVTARSDQCVSQPVEMYPQPIIKTWQRRLAILLTLAGMGVVVYLAILLLQFLVLRTPL